MALKLFEWRKSFLREMEELKGLYDTAKENYDRGEYEGFRVASIDFLSNLRLSRREHARGLFGEFLMLFLIPFISWPYVFPRLGLKQSNFVEMDLLRRDILRLCRIIRLNDVVEHELMQDMVEAQASAATYVSSSSGNCRNG